MKISDFVRTTRGGTPNRVNRELYAGNVPWIQHMVTTQLPSSTFFLPPLTEQHQIVSKVEARATAIDHLEAELDRQITRSNRLRQSTLAAAFTGSL